MTQGKEDGESSGGSDSEPSADNLDEEEMAKIVPTAKKPEIKPPEPPAKKTVTKKKELPPPSPKASPRVIVKVVQIPPKKIVGYNPFDRINKKKFKPETKDAWT
jgi:hypothetical protein